MEDVDVHLKQEKVKRKSEKAIWFIHDFSANREHSHNILTFLEY